MPGKLQTTPSVGDSVTNLFRTAQGHSVDELPYKAKFGVWGSYVGLFVNILCLIAQFYVALYPVGGPNKDPETFFKLYLAGPFLIGLYLLWKVYSFFFRPADRPFFVALKDIDIYSGMRESQQAISGIDVSDEHRRASISEMHMGEKKGAKQRVMGVIRSVF